MAILEITEQNFEEKVMNSGKPVVLDFWAPWCGPCRMQAPVFDECAEAAGDGAVFGKVNVDEQSHLAVQYDVMSIPTILVIKDKDVVFRGVGVQSREQILQAIP